MRKAGHSVVKRAPSRLELPTICPKRSENREYVVSHEAICWIGRQLDHLTDCLHAVQPRVLFRGGAEGGCHREVVHVGVSDRAATRKLGSSGIGEGDDAVVTDKDHLL